MTTETLRADAVLANNGCVTPTNATGAPNGTWTGNTGNTNWDCRWSVGDPANELTSGFTTHSAGVLVRREASGGNDPTCSLELWSSGSLVRELVAPTVVSSTTGQTLSATFTTAEAGAGANLEVRTVIVGGGGSPSSRRNAQIDAFTVTVDTSSVAANLVIQDGSHSHTADNLALTQVHALVVADAAHVHTADNLVLSSSTDLDIQDATHAHTAEALTLTQVHVLAIQNATHSHTADGIALTQVHSLAVQDAVHPHVADNLALTQVHQIVVQDSSHAHAADNLELTEGAGEVNLVISEAAHGLVSDNVVLAEVHVLVIGDSLHPHLADALTLTQVHQLAVQDGLHAVASDNLALSHVVPGGDLTKDELKAHLRMIVTKGVEDVHDRGDILSDIEAW